MSELTSILSQPEATVAVVGATDHPGKYGGIIYRDLKAKGYRVFAVNPNRESVDGDPCWPSVKGLPEKPSIANLVIPAERGLQVLDECEDAGIRYIWVQPGAESPELEQRLSSGPFHFLTRACIMVRAR